MEPYEDRIRRGGGQAVEAVSRFFTGEDEVHEALRRLAATLNSFGIPYAIAGGMALVGHGFLQATSDVDVLVTPEGFQAVRRHLLGNGYASDGREQMRDLATGVRIKFLIAGRFPGDRRPKPVAFPDPAEAGVNIAGICYVGLAALVELKLASGMTNPGRLKDLADVVSLVQELKLPREFRARLNEYVRPKYEELWDGLQGAVAGPG